MLNCVLKKLNESDDKDDDGNNKDFKNPCELRQGIDKIQGKVSRKDSCTCWH